MDKLNHNQKIRFIKKKIMNDIKVWKTKTIRIEIDDEIQIENVALQIAVI